MELTKSDIEKIRDLQYKKGKEWNWVKEKRKPSLADFGLTENDIEKIKDFKISETKNRVNAFLDNLKVILAFSPIGCFFLSPIIILIMSFFLEEDKLKVFFGVFSIFIFLTWIFGSIFARFMEHRNFHLRKSHKEVLYSKKLEYEEHKVLYDKWLYYNKIEEDQRKKRILLYNRNIKYFPYAEAFSEIFKDRFYKLDAYYWKDLDAFNFEKKVGELYKTQFGYNVTVTKQSGDGGVDVILRKDGKTKYVQCKHYCRSNRLGVSELREFFGVCAADSVKGIMVCTSELTAEAANFQKKIKDVVEIIGINELVVMSEGMQPFYDIESKLSYSFRAYLRDNLFLYLYHCYIFQECFKSEEAANNRLSQLKNCGDYNFCYKIIHLIDQNKLDYYFIAFLESKHKERYSEFKIDLPILSDISLMAKHIFEQENIKTPIYDSNKQTMKEYFEAHIKWRELVMNKFIADCELKNLFKKTFPSLPKYQSVVMNSQEYFKTFDEFFWMLNPECRRIRPKNENKSSL